MTLGAPPRRPPAAAVAVANRRAPAPTAPKAACNSKLFCSSCRRRFPWLCGGGARHRRWVRPARGHARCRRATTADARSAHFPPLMPNKPSHPSHPFVRTPSFARLTRAPRACPSSQGAAWSKARLLTAQCNPHRSPALLGCACPACTPAGVPSWRRGAGVAWRVQTLSHACPPPSPAAGAGYGRASAEKSGLMEGDRPYQGIFPTKVGGGSGLPCCHAATLPRRGAGAQARPPVFHVTKPTKTGVPRCMPVGITPRVAPLVVRAGVGSEALFGLQHRTASHCAPSF